MRHVRALVIGLLVVLGMSDWATAQEPKPGRDWYEDSIDLGFKFKAPEGWTFVPPQPRDTGMVGTYVGPSGQMIQNPKTYEYLDYSLYILKFDQRKPAVTKGGSGDEEDDEEEEDPSTLEDWIDGRLSRCGFKKTSTTKGKVGKVETLEIEFEGTLGNDYPIGLFATQYKLQPQLDVVLVFNGPGGKNWSKFVKAFKKITGTLQPIEVAATAAPGSNGPSSLRERKRAELQAAVAKAPGWELYESPNYFIVSDNKDKQFLKELQARLEAIRASYEEIYPPSLARELKLLAAQRRHESEKDKPEAAGGKEAPTDEDGAKPAAGTQAEADSTERSRCSVVRVCKDSDEYHSYGGPGGSAGYWSSGTEELVIYDDKAVGGRRDTWATLNHEAFHQYIFYFFGKLSPHSWYNEGNGDFFAGYQLKNNRFELKPFDWRVQTIKENIKKEGAVPLQDLVKFTQAEYYGNNKFGTDGGDNYAQGWSLIWFLRTGKKGASGWNDGWDPILDTYLRVLVETDDLDAAVQKAFADVDWAAFEKCWKDYTLSL